MKRFTLQTVKGTTVLTTTKGTPVLKGTPELVKTKFGSYLVFPETANAELTQINLRHQVFNEYRVPDGSKAIVFRQTKAIPGVLKRGAWHVDATTVRL
jgi:hypothetical protein